MTPDRMTAAEAERRVDSLFLLGGTPEERRFALKRWKEALLREYVQQASDQKRAKAKAVR